MTPEVQSWRKRNYNQLEIYNLHVIIIFFFRTYERNPTRSYNDSYSRSLERPKSRRSDR